MRKQIKISSEKAKIMTQKVLMINDGDDSENNDDDDDNNNCSISL